MISIYQLKPKFQELLRPILGWMHRFGITANQITIFSIVISFIIGILFWNSDQNKVFILALPIGLFIRMALNALDGMMATTYNQKSKLGEILNETGDIISDFFIFFPLLKFEKESIYLVILFLFMSVVNEFCGILGKAISDVRRYEGPMGKSDRAFVIGLYGLLSFLSVNLKDYFQIGIIIIILLLVISTVNRIKKTLN